MTTPTVPTFPRDALCAKSDGDLWFTEADRALALHLCKVHCPVADQCPTPVGFSHGVIAGVAYNQNGRPTHHQNADARRCTTCTDAREAETAERDATRPTTTVWPDCGTTQAYRRHCKRREHACRPCADAWAAAHRADRAAKKQAA